MERMWIMEMRRKYRYQWVVAVNLKWEEKNRMFGDVFLVTPDKDLAYAKLFELRESDNMGRATVVEGENDILYVGGLEVVCTQ